jgi:26S proteasome regulatory subunit N9
LDQAEFDEKVASEFYDKFLSEFEVKLNLLRLSKIIISISEKMKEKEGLTLVDKVLKKIQENKESSMILKIQKGQLYLRTKDTSLCKKILRETKDEMETFGYHLDHQVYSSYYRVESEYFKVTEAPNEYYKSALLYLAYTPLEEFKLVEQQRIAFDLGLSALLGDGIYNFGELLGHPIVHSLESSQAEWLLKLLLAFNQGDIQGFKNILSSNSNTSMKQKMNFLNEKIQLMSLMELVFTRLAGNRTIHFKEISKVTGNELDQVEIILLKALSLNLIKGVIDQVDESIYVTWVQPRVLDLNQVKSLNSKIGNWVEKVESTLNFLEKEGKLTSISSE